MSCGQVKMVTIITKPCMWSTMHRNLRRLKATNFTQIHIWWVKYVYFCAWKDKNSILTELRRNQSVISRLTICMNMIATYQLWEALPRTIGNVVHGVWIDDDIQSYLGPHSSRFIPLLVILIFCSAYFLTSYSYVYVHIIRKCTSSQMVIWN